MTEKDPIQVSTTTESREEAEAIARALIEERLAACVQVSGPITSFYRWKGNDEKAQEWLCQIKTRFGLFRRVDERIRDLHSYEVPEIVAVAIVAGSTEYLNWITAETQPSKQEFNL